MDDRSLRGALRVGEDAAALARIEAVSMNIEFEATRKTQQRAETRVIELNSGLRGIRFSGDGCRMPAGTHERCCKSWARQNDAKAEGISCASCGSF